jgi:hypothetical protein
VAQVDKFRGHFFAFASSWTKVAQADKFRGHFFGFASSWTKVAQADKLKGRQCILLYKLSYNLIIIVIYTLSHSSRFSSSFNLLPAAVHKQQAGQSSRISISTESIGGIQYYRIVLRIIVT